MTNAPPPPVQPPPLPDNAAQSQDSGVAVLIPYKNGPALISYYLGVFSLIPVLGFFLGIAAVITGFLGLSKAKKNPQVRGKVHAWVGIILGGLVFIAYAVVIGGIVYKGLGDSFWRGIDP